MSETEVTDLPAGDEPGKPDTDTGDDTGEDTGEEEEADGDE